jgi:hypothetical protein
VGVGVFVCVCVRGAIGGSSWQGGGGPYDLFMLLSLRKGQ